MNNNCAMGNIDLQWISSCQASTMAGGNKNNGKSDLFGGGAPQLNRDIFQASGNADNSFNNGDRSFDSGNTNGGLDLGDFN